jgi:hypothetical protein
VTGGSEPAPAPDEGAGRLFRRRHVGSARGRRAPRGPRLSALILGRASSARRQS